MPASAERAKNHHIQALRGVAASLVVVDHACGPLVEHGLLPQWFDVVRFSIGGLGVYTFFVISGFIMITTSFNDFGHASKSASFALRRIIRIVPTYWIATVLAFALYTVFPLSRHPAALELLKSLMFIPYSTVPDQDMQPVLAQGWTLNYEMFFYAMFTVALLLPRRIGLTVLFLSFVGIVVEGSFVKSLSVVSFSTTVFEFLSDPMILLFAVGMAIGIAKQKFSDLVIGRAFLIASLFLGVDIVFLVQFQLPPRVPFLLSILTWIPAMIAVVACAFGAPSRSSRLEFLSEAAGDASYSTYLFHIFVLVALSKVFPISAVTGWFYVVLAVFLANLFGFGFFRVIERPITRFLRRVSGGVNFHARPRWRLSTLTSD